MHIPHCVTSYEAIFAGHQIWVLFFVYYLHVSQVEVEILIYTLQGPRNLYVVLKFKYDLGCCLLLSQ